MIHVLSPHRDDAVFSLFFTLSALAKNLDRITVSNFFTESAYAPHASTNDAARVSDIRKREDRAALRRVDPAVRVRDYHLLDAPLRLSIPATEVCFTAPVESDIHVLSTHLRNTTGVTFAPLGLGGHVDHRVVKYAALRTLGRARLAFYEDLPYAMWSDGQLPSVLSEIEDRLQTTLRPIILRGSSVFEKRDACARYRSQIRAADAAAMADWSRRYGVAERVWVTRGCDLQSRLPHTP